MILDRTLIFALAFIAVAQPVAAQEIQTGRDRYAVTLHQFDWHPSTPAVAQRAVARIDRAAMAVCGAPRFGLRELERGVGRSSCLRDSLAEVRRQIDDPLLLQAWQHRF